jgi:hypothetical protein
MPNVKNPDHAKTVADWESRHGSGLTQKQKILLFEKALRAIEERTCQTLSRVTLAAVIDRLLHMGQDRFPILADAQLESFTFNFQAINESEAHGSEEHLAALRYLLIELLSVLSRITANILVAPLHQALAQVTWDAPEEK